MVEKSIGALWKHQNEKGEFYTGILDNPDGTKTKLVVFKNGYKDRNSKPDYLIYESKSTQENYKTESDELPF